MIVFSSLLFIEEMKAHAPSVLTVLRGCVHGRRRSRAKKQKSRMTDVDTLVSVCCAILLRGRSQKMNLLQRIISLILFCGHASKRVSNAIENKVYIIDHSCTNCYTQWQKLCLCLSHKATTACVDRFGKNFDAAVLQWKDNITRRMKEVCSGNTKHTVH